MDVYFEGTLKIFVKKEFDTAEGEHVAYNEAYFLTENQDGEETVIKINTKLDMSTLIDQWGVGKLQLQDNGKKRLVSFSAKANR